MDLLKKLNDAVGYLEKHLDGEMDLEKAAKAACLTKDSFLRFFSYMVGMTAAEYIRQRKLTLAAEDLRQGGHKVLDVALQYGYSSADAFSRAFRKQHGISPAAFQKGGGALRIVPPVSFHIIIKGAKGMDFQLVDRKETILYGVSKEFDIREFLTRESLRNAMWDEKQENVPGQVCQGGWNHPTDRSYDGLWYGLWRDGRYFIGREWKYARLGGLEAQVLPAGEYAAFATKPGGQAWEEIPRLFELIFDSWLPTSGYARQGEDIIEIYHLWTDREKRKKERYYEILVPVRKP